MAITLPLVVAAHSIYCVRTRGWRSRLRRVVIVSLPYCLVIAAYLLLRHHALGYLYVTQRDWILTPGQYVLTLFELVAKYWLKLLAPVDLNAYHVFEPVRSLAEMRALAAIAFLAAALAAMFFAFRRAPLAGFAASWVFLTLIPVLNVYGVGRNVFAERYLYVPSVGFCLLLALGLVWVTAHASAKIRVPVTVATAVVLLAFYIPQSFARNSVWQDDFTLFLKTLERSPNSAVVHNVVAEILRMDKNEILGAEQHYERALALAEAQNPPERRQIAFAREGLASIYASRGEIEKGLVELDRAQAAYPDDPQVSIARGVILSQAGRWQHAKGVLQAALAANPSDENVLNTLGLIAWDREHDNQRAIEYFQQALRLHPARDTFQAAVRNNLGAVYGEQQQYQSAIAEFEEAVKLQPNDAEFHTNLATAYIATGRFVEARAQLEAALRIAPDYPPARAALVEFEKAVQAR